MTGTPMIAKHELRKAYSFMDPRGMFVQGPQETQVDAMARILTMPERQVFARRRALRHLGQKLNRQAMIKLAVWAVEALVVANGTGSSADRPSNAP